MPDNNDLEANLRRAALAQREQPLAGFDDSSLAAADSGKLFGMTAIERMFLSIGLFGVILVISLIMLIASDSIYLGF